MDANLINLICAMSPYCLYVQGEGCAAPFQVVDIDFGKSCVILKHKSKGLCDGIANFGFEDDIKPYLRPMYSMTDEEKEEFEKISHCFLKTIVLKRDRKLRIIEQKAYFDNEIPSSGAFGDSGDYRYIEQEYFVNLIDWLNEHHFDYRGLIEKALALEAPEGMYN